MNQYTFRIEFTTGDNLYHVNAFYQVDVSFTPEPIDLEWATSFVGPSSNPWTITNDGRSIRFSVENSTNCGGTNDQTQSGTAITTIELESAPTIKTSGGRIVLRNGLPSCSCCVTNFGLLARGTSDGQGLGCEMGPIVSEFIVPQPYRLSKDVFMNLEFSGVGELEDSGYENISFFLDSVI
jgi:hypothetical protein